MALAVSPRLIPLLALRTTQAPAAPVLIAAATAPLVAKQHRATFLSLGSLSGRLTYGVALLGLGYVDEFSRVAAIGAIGAVAALLLLLAGSWLAGPDDLRQQPRLDY